MAQSVLGLYRQIRACCSLAVAVAPDHGIIAVFVYGLTFSGS
jgi:hypothetical protein